METPKKVIEEYRGIRNLVAAPLLKDDDTELTYGTPFPIAGIAELSKATESNTEAHYYDNIPAISMESEGVDTVTCNCSAIPLEILAKLTGQFYDDETGTFVEGESERPYLAIGYITETTSHQEIFVWRLKVKCSLPDSSHKTKDSGTGADGQSLVFTGINTTHKFSTSGKTAKAALHKKSNLYTENEYFSAVQDIDKIKTKSQTSQNV